MYKIYSASVKSYQYLNSTFWKIYNTDLWLLLHVRSCFWSTTDWFEEINSSTSARTMVHVMHMLFMLFAVFKNLKSSSPEDNMPVHALDIFIENAAKMV